VLKINPSVRKIPEILSASQPVLLAAASLEQHRVASIKQLAGSARCVFVASLWHASNTPFIVVVEDDKAVDDVSHDLQVLCDPGIVHGVKKTQRVSGIGSSDQLSADELDAIIALESNPRAVLVLTPESLFTDVPSKTGITENKKLISRSMHLDLAAFVQELALHGFSRTDYVGKPGEMAVRGGIVDVYPSGWNNPVRLEFLGDLVDSIREFEPLSQRSIRELDHASILTHVYHRDDTDVQSTLLSHVPENAIVVLDAPDTLATVAAKHPSVHLPELELWMRVLINPLSATGISTSTSAQPSFAGSIEQLLAHASMLTRKNVAVHIGADGQHNAARLRDLCENIADSVEEDNDAKGLEYHSAIDRIAWYASTLSSGFVWPEVQLAVFSEHQVFGRQRSQRRSKRSESGITQRELRQLHHGDYVVHADKGIGQFQGIKTIKIGPSFVDCVKLVYQGGDTLYVHLNYIHKLSKFTAEEGALPKLSKLGSAEWDRKKERAKKRIKDIARDLIKLYARRKSIPGFAFPADTVWQKEFEAAFQYEDTPDQARTTAEVKMDMEQSSPMDRLVCGDVGFGKTEIAIRAAFKAAQSGKQVAVLVPTTILAQQHYLTFTDRLHRYPIKIEVLSRFKSKSEQKEIVAGLMNGSVDVVVGTHRLLSKDVSFRQLGLLIIDEEHRFGVGAKEKLRQLRASVDTLTLTATPIPRTLNFSLMGARDLSVIETPPRNRLPVKTEILQWDDDAIAEALHIECNRGGQVFVVTDRIADIDKLAQRIQMLAPTLRYSVAHGQMSTGELEKAMEAFLERKTDVLIATKIIESGLDIPNANTMIINNADNFGLAELYQLRGRVGRSNTQAYCYLVIPPVHTLSRTSIQRLQALEEYTDLGSGFQLAMRDLEIRGAGNLLGGEQSGFILDMGFELYHRILDEAVAELRHDEFSDIFGSAVLRNPFINEDVVIELDCDALLPASWIPADTDRYETYKKLYSAASISEIDTVFDDLRDRFGVPPTEASNLLFAVALRIAALPTGLVKISLHDTTLTIDFPPESNSVYYEQAFPGVLTTISTMPNARLIQKGKKLSAEIQLARREHAADVLTKLTPELHHDQATKTSLSEQ